MLGRRIAVAATLTLVATACGSGQLDAKSTEVAGSASAALVSSTTQTVSHSASAAAKKLSGARKASKVTIKVLPQVVQPGKSKASATSAKVAVSTTVSPKRKTVVTLQVKAGSSWKKVSSASTASNGKHVFAANLTRSGKAATYRVVVGARASAAASTAPWMKATFTDQFSGSKLSSTWSHASKDYNPSGMRNCSKGSPKATKVSGGTLRLSVIKDTSRKDLCNAMRDGKSSGKFAYRLNGHVVSQDKFSFKHGVAAARIKFPRAMGQHGSFWMMPQEHVTNVVDPKLTGAEIDVVESFGERYSKKHQGMSSFTYHWEMQGKQGVKVKTGGYIPNIKSFLSSKSDNWWDRYHVYSVEWTPTEYIFHIDGKETWRSKRGVSGQPQYLALSLLSSDYELSLLKGDKNLPQHMNVDWIRAWETPKS